MTKGALQSRDWVLAIVSALLGALAAYGLQVLTTPVRKIEMMTTSMNTQYEEMDTPINPDVPDRFIQKFALRNASNTTLRNFTIEFTPAGDDDASFDPKHVQKIWVTSASDQRRTGMTGSKIVRRNNTIFVKYDILRRQQKDEIYILNDGLANYYIVDIVDADIELEQSDVLTDFGATYDYQIKHVAIDKRLLALLCISLFISVLLLIGLTTKRYWISRKKPDA